MVDILHIIKEDVNITQRDLSKKTGFALGTVNQLIKKCAKKGLLEINKISSRKIKYLLTASGMKVVTKKTLSYVQRSYQIILEMKELIQNLTERIYPDKKICILLKENDEYQEIWNLVRENLNSMGKNYMVYKSITELNKNIVSGDCVIFYWNPDLESDLNNLDVCSVNIIERLKILKE